MGYRLGTGQDLDLSWHTNHQLEVIWRICNATKYQLSYLQHKWTFYSFPPSFKQVAYRAHSNILVFCVRIQNLAIPIIPKKSAQKWVVWKVQSSCYPFTKLIEESLHGSQSWSKDWSPAMLASSWAFSLKAASWSSVSWGEAKVNQKDVRLREETTCRRNNGVSVTSLPPLLINSPSFGVTKWVILTPTWKLR